MTVIWNHNLAISDLYGFSENHNAQHPRLSGKNRPGDIKITLTFIGDNSFRIAVFIVLGCIDPYQFSRKTIRKCMGKDLTLSNNEKI